MLTFLTYFVTQAKAMLNSWSIQTTTSDDVSGLSEVVGGGFYTDNLDKDTQSVANTKEYSWLFGGLPGIKK